MLPTRTPQHPIVLALALTAATPIFLALRVAQIQLAPAFTAVNEGAMIFVFGCLVVCAILGTYLAYHAPNQKSPITVASIFLGAVSITLQVLFAIPLILLRDFGPS
jgi:hypothetical protein